MKKNIFTLALVLVLLVFTVTSCENSLKMPEAAAPSDEVISALPRFLKLVPSAIDKMDITDNEIDLITKMTGCDFMLLDEEGLAKAEKAIDDWQKTEDRFDEITINAEKGGDFEVNCSFTSKAVKYTVLAVNLEDGSWLLDFDSEPEDPNRKATIHSDLHFNEKGYRVLDTTGYRYEAGEKIKTADVFMGIDPDIPEGDIVAEFIMYYGEYYDIERYYNYPEDTTGLKNGTVLGEWYFTEEDVDPGWAQLRTFRNDIYQGVYISDTEGFNDIYIEKAAKEKAFVPTDELKSVVPSSLLAIIDFDKELENGEINIEVHTEEEGNEAIIFYNDFEIKDSMENALKILSEKGWDVSDNEALSGTGTRIQFGVSEIEHFSIKGEDYVKYCPVFKDIPGPGEVEGLTK